MKYILALMLMLPGVVHADLFINPNRLQLSAGSDCVGVSVSSGTAATVISASSGYSYASVENEDASDNLFCAMRSNVATSGANRGKKIAATKEKLFILAPLFDTLYCITDHAAGQINVMLCRGK
jgi:hypothetical protein